VKQVICSLLTLYLIILLFRAVMSFFPIRPGTVFATIYRVMIDLTEPVLAPMRRIIPPAGMFDLSFLVLFILVEVVLRALACPVTIF
jgi:YggT family protein